MTLTELQNNNFELSSISNLKLSALTRQLVEEGKVAKILDKKRAKFKLI